MFTRIHPISGSASRMMFLGMALVCAFTAAPDGTEPAVAPPSPSVEQRLRMLSLEEKLDLLGGSGFGTTAIPRTGIPVFNMSDGPLGVRSPAPSTAFAGGMALAATWDPALAQEVGAQMGRDARARGINFLLAPGVNIYRTPLNGRNFEYYGEDPYLGARIAVQFISGIQSQNVSATIKHFAANNSEFARHTSNSIVDQRALREIYLPIFESAVKEAHVGAVMSSYNHLNGLRTTANPPLINTLKHEWGFDGVYMSDWGATYDGIAAARAGLDLEMPTGAFMNRATLASAVKQGIISESEIDAKVRRLLNLAQRFDWFRAPGPDLTIPAYNQAGKAVALRSALESMVLLKNDAQLLPLDPARTRKIAVIGPNAHPAVVTGGGSGRVRGFSPTSALQGISDRLGEQSQVTYASGIRSLASLALTTPFTVDATNTARGIRVEVFKDAKLSGAAVAERIEPRFQTGTAGFGTELFDAMDSLPTSEVLAQLNEAFAKSSTFERWSAAFTPQASGSHTLFVQSMVAYRLIIDGKVVIDSSKFPVAALRHKQLVLEAKPHSVVFEQLGTQSLGRPFWRVGIVRDDSFVDAAAIELARQADVVVVVAGFNSEIEGEGFDREFSLPPGQDALINAMAAANSRTIVVVNSGGSVDVSKWIDRVPALIAAWYPGQEGGTALARLIFGDESPSGRLPISWERRLEDNPSYSSYYPDDAEHPNDITYREGVFVGYRGMQNAGVQPSFPFGFGLSYSTFAYENVRLNPHLPKTARDESKALFELSFDATNTGKRPAATVAQVYVAPTHARVARPPRELKSFARVRLAPGETRRVSLSLDARAFAYYDVKRNDWRVDAGEYLIELGDSADDIRARIPMRLNRTLHVPIGNTGP